MLSSGSSSPYSLPVDRPLVSPVMVGRAAHVQALDDALLSAANGAGSTMLLSGEAGVGKSRCIFEAEARALRNGLLPVNGNCFENDRTLPYAPLLDLFRSLWSSHSTDEREAYWRPYASVLVKLLPDLEALVGTTREATLDPAQEKQRLFLSFQGILSNLAARQPLLLIIEDLHWADDISLEFLLYLARHIRNASLPILLLATYRSDEATHGSALQHWLAALDRERLANELHLVGLPKDDVSVMLQAIFGLDRPVRADFLDAIYTLTEGNAFFIEEVLKSLAQSGDIFLQGGVWERKPVQDLRIPRSVQDAVARRTAGLSPDASAALLPASVIGRRFDFLLLQAITGRDESSLLQSVKELIAAQLVVEESEDLFSFRHALTRQSVYSGLLTRERRAMHKMVAEKILEVYGANSEPHIVDLAYHYYEAGIWSEAFDYARKAGDAARAVFAPGAAIQHYSRAKDAAHKMGIEPPAYLYLARASQYELMGEFDNARHDLETALRLCHASNDAEGEWHALIDLGKLWAGRDYGRAGEYFVQSLERSRSLDNPLLLAHSLNRVGNWYVNKEQASDAVGYHMEALDIFTRLNDRPGEAETLDLLGMLHLLDGDLATSTQHLRRAVDIFTDLGNLHNLASSLSVMAVSAGAAYQGDMMVTLPRSELDGLRESDIAIEVVRNIGWRAGEAFILFTLTYIHAARGDYGKALDAAYESLKIAEELNHEQWLSAACCALGAILMDLYSLSEAQAILEKGRQIAENTGSLLWIRSAVGYLAWCFIEQGEPDQARSLLAEAGVPDLPMISFGQRRIWLSQGVYLLAKGEAEAALDLIANLYASAHRHASTRDKIVPRLSMMRGQALLMLNKYEEAEVAFKEVIPADESNGLPGLIWRTNVSLAELYSKTSRPIEAANSLAAAYTLVQKIADDLPTNIKANFLQGVEPYFSGYRPESTPKPSNNKPTRPGGLTSRELQVVALVAQGKSNREIADELILGERTVETHLENARSKLGFASRVQLATWALEQGIK